MEKDSKVDPPKTISKDDLKDSKLDPPSKISKDDLKDSKDDSLKESTSDEIDPVEKIRRFLEQKLGLGSSSETVDHGPVQVRMRIN